MTCHRNPSPSDNTDCYDASGCGTIIVNTQATTESRMGGDHTQQLNHEPGQVVRNSLTTT
jgi:hypothetical protein